MTPGEGGPKARAGPASNHGDELTGEELSRLAQVLRDAAGIQLGDKRLLTETRLRKRAHELGLPTLRHYCDNFLSGDGEPGERQHLIDALTTNKTGFFREAHHFEFLAAEALPGLGKRRVEAWSAGCATGEEAWTLAMVLARHAERVRGFDFRVLATDVSTRALQHAAAAVYSEEDVIAIDGDMRRKYLMRSRDSLKRVVKVVPELREKVQFTHANLVAAEPEISPCADLVFCRNVMIYFDKQTQHLLLERLVGATAPGGYLFLGHSEALVGHDWPLDAVAPTTYRRRATA